MLTRLSREDHISGDNWSMKVCFDYSYGEVLKHNGFIRFVAMLRLEGGS